MITLFITTSGNNVRLFVKFQHQKTNHLINNFPTLGISIYFVKYLLIIFKDITSSTWNILVDYKKWTRQFVTLPRKQFHCTPFTCSSFNCFQFSCHLKVIFLWHDQHIAIIQSKVSIKEWCTYPRREYQMWLHRRTDEMAITHFN